MILYKIVIAYLKLTKNIERLHFLAGHYGLLAYTETLWEDHESKSRIASIALFELMGEHEEAKAGRAREAMWQASRKAMRKGKLSCTEDAVRAWKKIYGTH